MRIGIDISQIVYEGTGVGNYVREMVRALLAIDHQNEYILFGSSLRKRQKLEQFYQTVKNSKVTLCVLPIPPTILDFLWNRLHIIPIEWFIGTVDVFWSSDWTQPPLARAKGVTTVHDLTVIRNPESFGGGLRNIVETQKRRLKRAIKLNKAFFCDSEATKRDAHMYLHIPNDKIHVVYPGV